MKHKTPKQTDAFAQLRTKIFWSTIGLVAAAVCGIYLLYTLLLKGNFANWIVTAYQKIFQLDYYAARTLYQWSFRNYIELVFMVGVALIFLAAFRIYLRWFTKYFAQINNAIDSLVSERAAEVSLSPELSAIEKKINTVKHTLEKQRLDARIAEQRKNDLIVYLAHDLKTPLASVIGYLNLLHDEQQISDGLREKYLSVSLEKAERLEDLINEFFEIAKYSLSEITLRYGTINVTRLLEMLLFEFKPMLREKNLSCELEGEKDLCIRCDADKMQRVFDNLLRNAVLYSFAGTQITVAVSRQEEEIAVSFTNYGEEIPKEKLERIFEQFYRLDAARSTSSGGAGLGLAIARRIVTLHGGTITAQSADGRVTFVVTLPVS